VHVHVQRVQAEGASIRQSLGESHYGRTMDMRGTVVEEGGGIAPAAAMAAMTRIDGKQSYVSGSQGRATLQQSPCPGAGRAVCAGTRDGGSSTQHVHVHVQS